jgi:hypothetical protein
VLGDAGRDGVEFDAGHAGAGWRETDEVPRAAARFQDSAGCEAEVLRRLPDDGDQGGIGVVGVQGVAAGGRQFGGV